RRLPVRPLFPYTTLFRSDLVDVDNPVTHSDGTVALQLRDRRPGHAGLGQPVRQHPPAVRLDQAVPVRRDAVVESYGIQRADRCRSEEHTSELQSPTISYA